MHRWTLTKIQSLTIALLVAFLPSGLARAGFIVNGTFSSGLSSWTTNDSGAVQNSIVMELSRLAATFVSVQTFVTGGRVITSKR